MGDKLHYVGPSGAGNVAKLVNNLLVAAHMITTSEALRLSVAAGVPAEAVLPVLNAATGRSAISEFHVPKWIMSEAFNSGFTFGLMRKDARLALELADRVSLHLPLSEHVAKIWKQSEETFKDSDDFTRLAALK
jgi:3-hydroxyisobutyrate dehydrogenase